MKTTETLKEKYIRWVNRLKEQKVVLVSFTCPHCGAGIETLPASGREVWDSLASCPFCESVFMKLVSGKRVITARFFAETSIATGETTL
ncbi:hypothetical protein Q4R26_09330 [Morganella morganii]|uniref:hypothetical protein n=1 Tax=Morganella morganii TaxID=582 RepID=UPI000B3F76B5|nr:hypothetical protein [Morganella morganii]OVF56676.1 hypothetical protein B5724_05280 [Morganella morganii]HEI8485915.1 hypothetical protein [Morganella morganii]